MKIASTNEINERIISKTTVSYLGFSMLSYTLPRKIKPIPALIVTEYLNSLQVSPVSLSVGSFVPLPPMLFQSQLNHRRIYSYLILLK